MVVIMDSRRVACVLAKNMRGHARSLAESNGALRASRPVVSQFPNVSNYGDSALIQGITRHAADD
jgi:hypothetical protein